MDLSVNDLIFKPETAGPGMLKPSARHAGEVASLAAFNDLLSQLSQAHRNAAAGASERVARPTQGAPDHPTFDETHWEGRNKVERSDSIVHGDEADHTCDRERRAEDKDYDRGDSDDPAGAAGDANNQSISTVAEAPEGKPTNTAGTEIKDQTTAGSGNEGKATTTSGPLNAAAIAAGSNVGADRAAAKVAMPNPTAAATATFLDGNNNRPQGPRQDIPIPAEIDEVVNAAKSLVAGSGALRMAKGNNSTAGTAGQGSNATVPVTTAGAVAFKPSDLSVQADTQIEVSFDTRFASSQPRSTLTTGILATQEIAQGQEASSQQPASSHGINGMAKGSASAVAAMTTAGSEVAGALQQNAGPLPSPQQYAAMDTGSGPSPASTSASGATGSAQGIFLARTATGPQFNHGSPSSALASARAPQPLPVPVDQFAVHIARAAATGTDQISIKLKPAHLGQVDVKLEVTHDGRVAAVVTAHHADTLDLLQRNARALEHALQDAGLKTDSNSLQFNLHSQTGSGRESAWSHVGDNTVQSADLSAEQDTAAGSIIAGYQNWRAAQGGIDISV